MSFRLRGGIKKFFHSLMTSPSTIKSWLQWKYKLFILTFKSLFYNERLYESSSYSLEVLMTPLMWFVDHFVGILGPVLMFGVVFLTTTVVYIVYWIGWPYYRDYHPILFVILVPYGHWVLVNVVFHFYMACTTKPGSPMKVPMLSEAIGVCKKCVSPKPPRTHHCSVCNICVLKMDHHCPWINGCVGHFNHRFFFLFMAFMMLGCSFIICFGAEIAIYEIWLGGSTGAPLRDTVYRLMGLAHWVPEEDIEGYIVRTNGTHVFKVIDGMPDVGVSIKDEEARFAEERRLSYWLRFTIVYTGLLTVGCMVSLSMLAGWHFKLITRGETSIEQLINKKERTRFREIGQKYVNPYNFGRRENWLIFLGINQGSNRSFLRHVLFPSTHPPEGTGLTWRTVYENSCDSHPMHQPTDDFSSDALTKDGRPKVFSLSANANIQGFTPVSDGVSENTSHYKAA